MSAVLCILVMTSGAAALIYEVAWFRCLGLILGNTVHVAAILAAAFMAGLGTGSLYIARLLPKVSRPFLLLAFVEMLIGLAGYVVSNSFGCIDSVHISLYRSFAGTTVASETARCLLAGLVLVPPTFLMGLTLPLAVEGSKTGQGRLGQTVGLLYGANTAGAVLGTLVAGFVLLPSLGLRGTGGIAVALNIAASAMAFVMDRSCQKSGAQACVSSISGALRKYEGSTWVCLLAAIAGALSLALEIIWFRALVLVTGATTYSFTLMLSLFLLGIAIGGAVGGRYADRTGEPLGLFGWSQLLIGAITVVGVLLVNVAPYWTLHVLKVVGLSWEGLMLAVVTMCLLFLVIPAFLSGFSFSLLVKAYAGTRESASVSVGRVYAWNSCGCIAGSLVAGFILLPIVGIRSTFLIIASMGILIWMTVAFAEYKSHGRLQATVSCVGLAFLLLVWLGLPEWNKQVLASGVYFSPWNHLRGNQIVLDQHLNTERLLVYHEGKTATVSSSVAEDETRHYSSDGKVEADTSSRSLLNQYLVGHLPMLFHRNPERVLNIGLGAGTTLGAMGTYPVKTLNVVEIEPEITRVARVWSDLNHDVVRHPCFGMIVDDGRHYLKCTTDSYDVIASDPFEPVVAGAANLFTVEHFQNIKSRLNSGGVVCQWIPMYEMSEDDFRILLRTFASVFPNGMVFFTGTDIVVVSGRDGERLELETMRAKFGNRKVAESLKDVGLANVECVLGLMVCELSAISADRGGVLNTQDRPVIEFSAPKSALEYQPNRNQNVLLGAFGSLPSAWTRELTDGERERIGVLREGMRLVLQSNVRRASGKAEEANAALRKALQTSLDNPVCRNEGIALMVTTARAGLSQGFLEEVKNQYGFVLQMDPANFWALYDMVTVLMLQGNEQAASGFLARGMKIYPDSPLFTALEGKMMGTRGDFVKACDRYEKALKLLPRHPTLRNEYEYFLNLRKSGARNVGP